MYKLDPMLEDGLLRFKGHLVYQQRLVIIPKDSHITTLTLRNTWKLQKEFYVVQAAAMVLGPLCKFLYTVRKFLSRCVVCRKVRTRGKQQKLANLPKDRLQPDKPPFTHVGTDYSGPFWLKEDIQQ